MPYTTAEDVQKYYLGTVFEDSDYLKLETITQWIAEFSSEIDMTLRRKYTLPISDASDLIFLKILCEEMVVGKADDVLRVSATDEEKEFLRFRGYTKKSTKKLENLMSGKLILAQPQKSLAPIKYLRREQ